MNKEIRQHQGQCLATLKVWKEAKPGEYRSFLLPCRVEGQHTYHETITNEVWV